MRRTRLSLGNPIRIPLFASWGIESLWLSAASPVNNVRCSHHRQQALRPGFSFQPINRPSTCLLLPAHSPLALCFPISCSVAFIFIHIWMSCCFASSTSFLLTSDCLPLSQPPPRLASSFLSNSFSFKLCGAHPLEIRGISCDGQLPYSTLGN